MARLIHKVAVITGATSGMALATAKLFSPGTIDTPILDGVPKEAPDYMVSLIPRGSMGRPEEIAALFLASSSVTGSELFVDGGVAQI